MDCKFKVERIVDGAPSQIPTLKFLTPQHPQVQPLGHDPGTRMKIPLDMFYIFYLWEDTHSDPRVKTLIVFCSLRHPHQFDMPHDHVQKIIIFYPLSTPGTQALEQMSCSICFISFICKNTHKVWYKNFEIDFVIVI